MREKEGREKGGGRWERKKGREGDGKERKGGRGEGRTHLCDKLQQIYSHLIPHLLCELYCIITVSPALLFFVSSCLALSHAV